MVSLRLKEVIKSLGGFTWHLILSVRWGVGSCRQLWVSFPAMLQPCPARVLHAQSKEPEHSQRAMGLHSQCAAPPARSSQEGRSWPWVPAVSLWGSTACSGTSAAATLGLLPAQRPCHSQCLLSHGHPASCSCMLHGQEISTPV